MIVLVLNGSLFRNVTLVSHWASRSALFADIFSNLVRLLTALSQARRGLTHPVTVMFYTPASGAVQRIRNIHGHRHSTRRLVRLCRHLSKNMNCEADRSASQFIFFERYKVECQQTMQIGSPSETRELRCGTESRSIPAQSKTNNLLSFTE